MEDIQRWEFVAALRMAVEMPIFSGFAGAKQAMRAGEGPPSSENSRQWLFDFEGQLDRISRMGRVDFVAREHGEFGIYSAVPPGAKVGGHLERVGEGLIFNGPSLVLVRAHLAAQEERAALDTSVPLIEPKRRPSL